MGSMAFALCIRFPESKSAPLARWAFIILSVSSMSVGINLSAMLIIMPISWTGTFIFFRGPMSRSMPSVRAIGDVVYVKMDVPIMKMCIRDSFYPQRVLLAGVAASRYWNSDSPDLRKVYLKTGMWLFFPRYPRRFLQVDVYKRQPK